MKLYEEILKEKGVLVTPSELNDIEKAIVKTECYTALQKIKTIIEDDSLSDFDCVEKIVRVFEEIGSDGGGRHDFG